MIDVLVSMPLTKAIGARRETQRHLDCVTRQIAARAGRQAITAKVRSRARRRSGPRLYHQELADSLTFERWGEFDTLTCRLAVQEQTVDALELGGVTPAQPRTGGSQRDAAWMSSDHHAARVSRRVVGLAMTSPLTCTRYRTLAGLPFLFVVA